MSSVALNVAGKDEYEIVEYQYCADVTHWLRSNARKHEGEKSRKFALISTQPKNFSG